MVDDLLLQHHYAGLFGVPTVEPNKGLTAKQASTLPIYAKWQIMPQRDRMGTLSNVQESGLLQITLFVDVGEGTKLINEKAKAIVNHFGTEKSHMIDGVQIMVMSSTAIGAMPDGEGKYMQPITIEYRIFSKCIKKPVKPNILINLLSELVNVSLPYSMRQFTKPTTETTAP